MRRGRPRDNAGATPDSRPVWVSVDAAEADAEGPPPAD